MVPAKLEATQVYSPACFSDTDSIVKPLTRFEPANDMPLAFLCMVFPFKVHVIFNGLSPFDTVHCTDIVLPSLTSSSPKVNGKICGMTKMTRLIFLKGLWVKKSYNL